MAHRSNVTQVSEKIETQDWSKNTVEDPVCGMKLERRTSKHVLFRPDETVYFCSRVCLDKYVKGQGKKAA